MQQIKSWLQPEGPKVDPEVIARFRPPALETLFAGGLRSVQILCLLGSIIASAGFFGWNSSDLVWLPFGVFAAHLLSFYRGLWLEQNFRPNHFLVVVAEWVAIFLLMLTIGVGLNLLGTYDPLQTVLPDFIVIAAAWQMGRSWSRHFFYLFVQPDEVSPEEGGLANFRYRATLATDHRQAYDEMKAGWYWLAGIQLIIVLLATSLANAFDENKPGRLEFSQSLLIFAALHLLLGLPLLAWGRLRYLRTGWRLSHLTEPPLLATRWSFYLVGLTLAALLPALALSRLDLSGLLPRPGPARPPEVPTPLPQSLTKPIFVPPTPLVPPSEPSAPLWDLSGLFSVIGFILLALMLLAILLFALFMLSRAGGKLPRLSRLNLLNLWQNFRAWLGSLFGPGRLREGFEKENRESSNLFGRFQRERLPNDPRGRVRFHYRQLIERGKRAGLARDVGQTPAEYAAYLSPKLLAETENEKPAENLDLAPDLLNLTELYEAARYSPHPIVEEQARQARHYTERLNAYLRRKTRRARPDAASSPVPAKNDNENL